MLQNDLPIESDALEISILEYTIHDRKYGINVMKVREIINPLPVTPVPNTHKTVEGIIELHGEVLPVVHLEKALTGKKSNENTSDKFIICEFNQIKMAFRVHTVTQIHHLTWMQIEKPSEMYQGFETKLTGVVKQEDEMILLVDVEKLAIDIYPESGITDKYVRSVEKRMRENKNILLVEDSPLLRKLLTQTLIESGFEKIITVENGEMALEYVKKMNDEVHLIITDIEMPQIDGFQLTKLIKTDEKCKHIPIIIFSSMDTAEIKNRSIEAGADAQICKPEIDKLIQNMDKLVR